MKNANTQLPAIPHRCRKNEANRKRKKYIFMNLKQKRGGRRSVYV